MPEPAICVIITTFNRKAILLRCLEHLERQTEKDFHVSIVDDGSTDGTQHAVEQYRTRAAFPLQYRWQPNAGQARARNVAIQACNAGLSVLIGDDIFASPTFVEQHLAFHRANSPENVVAIGLTEWCEEGQKVTPFMRWLAEDGVQFQNAALLAGLKPGWQHFYTSNLSFKTSYFKANPFEERFQSYGYEDVELGFRLSKLHGLELHFLPGAVAEHLHPVDYLGSCRRMQAVGQSALTFKQLWPEFSEYPPLSPGKERLLRLIGKPAVLAVMSRTADVLTRFWCPNPLMKRVLSIHGRIGFELAKRRGDALIGNTR